METETDRESQVRVMCYRQLKPSCLVSIFKFSVLSYNFLLLPSNLSFVQHVSLRKSSWKQTSYKMVRRINIAEIQSKADVEMMRANQGGCVEYGNIPQRGDGPRLDFSVSWERGWC